MTQKNAVNINHMKIMCVACLKQDKKYSDSYDDLAEIQETFIDLLICQIGVDSPIVTTMQTILSDGNSFCHSCSKLLLDIYSFRKQCLTSSRRLNLFYGELEKQKSFEVKIKTYKDISKENEMKTSVDTFSYTDDDSDDEVQENNLDLAIKSEPDSLDFQLQANKFQTSEENTAVTRNRAKKRENNEKPKKFTRSKTKKSENETEVPGKTLRSKTKEDNNICRHCCEIFDSSSQLDSLYKEEHTELHSKYTNCPYCGKEVLRAGLSLHKVRHHSEKRFVCTECSKAFSTRGEVEVHFKRNHTPVEWVLCKVCGKKLKADGLKRHTVAMHSKKQQTNGTELKTKNVSSNEITIKNEPLDEYT